MARSTDSGSDLNSQQINETTINEKVNMDETGTFFIDPNANGEFGLSKNDLAYMCYKHKQLSKNYDKLMKYYRGNHDKIINQANKANGKPDNRIILNYPKQLVNAYVGYFAGVNPSFSIGKDDDNINAAVDAYNEQINQFNDNNDINHFFVQQAKYVDIFGRSYGLVYQDEEGETRVTTVDPRDGFIVYSNDVSATPIFAVRYRKSSAFASETIVDVYGFEKYYQVASGGVKQVALNYHAYGLKIYNVSNDEIVPFEQDKISYGRLAMVEFNSNDEKLGIYQDLISVFDAIDSAISEKKNDVDYFGDVILFINNMLLEEDGMNQLRDYRILMSQSVDGGTTNQGAEFLDKPSADTTQENLINRLISSIYDISGVVNLNDKDFTNAASGQALKQRLQGMRQNADTKASFFERSFKNVYKCLFTGLRNPDALKELSIKFKKNEPLDVLDESQALVNLANVTGSGMLSQETALGNMSFVENPLAEMEKIKHERAGKKETMEDVQINSTNDSSDK